MRLHNLAQVCRDAGLNVVEIEGWQSRGREFRATPRSIVCHHTAGASQTASRKDYPSLAVVKNGRRGLPGPLAQLGLGFSGTVYVIASGVANHAGRVGDPSFSNAASIGIEAENSGREPWPPAEMDAYVRLVAALQHAYGIPTSRVRGHKEVAIPRGRKPDPSFSMDLFRSRLTGAASSTPSAPHEALTTGDDDMLRMGQKDQPGTFEIRTLQRAINGVNHRTAQLGAEQVEEIAVDGSYGPATAKGLAHALPRAMAVCGVDWHKDWTDQAIGPQGLALLQMAVIRLGDQLNTKAATSAGQE